MKFIDILIIAISVLLIALVVYFAFIKKKEHCTGCPYKKRCDNQSCGVKDETTENKNATADKNQNKKE